MKKVTRAGILSLVFVLAFMFISISAEVAAAGRFVSPTDKGYFRLQGIQIQAKHYWDYQEAPAIHLNKHRLTLQKGKSETLTASLLPGGKSVSVDEWSSSNPKIAKVSQSGKVTAVAAGTAIISAYSKKYGSVDWDKTGHSCSCYITVPGELKDAKPLGTSDRTYSYGNTKFTVPTSKYEEALANVKKKIGGYAGHYIDIYGIPYNKCLIFGSKDSSKAHTYIYIDGSEYYDYGYGIEAREKSPLKTSRGISIGSKKSTVQQKYGLPTEAEQFMEAGKTYEKLRYTIQPTEEGLFSELTFVFLKSKDTVTKINFYLGTYGSY